MFYQPARKSRNENSGKALKFSVIALVLVGFFALIWMATVHRDRLETEDLNPQVVQAPTTPVREKPENPGGMEVPHQDKQVFDLLAVDDSGTMTREELVVIEEPAPATATPTPQAPQAAPTETPAATKPVENTATQAPAPVQQPAASAPAAAPAPEGSWGVQLGSFRSQADADRAARTYNEKYPDLLSSLSLDIQQADLGAKGIVYRVRFFGVADKSAASDLCRTFTGRNQGCLNVRK